MSQQELHFQPHRQHEPLCAVMAVTPADAGHMHTYYDVCPWSPSGRYLTCLRLSFEDRQPGPGDSAWVCVIDLERRTVRPVWETTGWGFQTAAHQQWGKTDRRLYFNDKRGHLPVGVRLDLETGRASFLDGGIWQVYPDETFAISPCLVRANLTQPGYGVTVAPEHQRVNTDSAAEDDGLYRVDLQTGRRTLLVSLGQAWEILPDRGDLEGAVLYAFHCKFNPQGTRILLVVRARFADGSFLSSLLACRADGTELRVLVGHRLWRRGGHHPIWCPDGRAVLMNLTPAQAGMRFCLVDADSGQLTVLTEDPPGGGHPSLSPDGRLLLTDETREAGGVRRSAIRLVDLPGRGWRDLCAVESPAAGASPLRPDAHPVWDRAGRRICFLGAPAGVRRVLVADPALPPGEEIGW
jgi:hypothetical protein